MQYDYDSMKASPITCDEAKARLQKVLLDYLKTEEGKRLLKSHGDSLNWIQALAAISPRAFSNNGMKLLNRECYCDSVVLNAEEPIDLEECHESAYQGPINPCVSAHSKGYKILPIVLSKTGTTLMFRYNERVVGDNVMQRLEDAVKTYLCTKEGSIYLHDGVFDWNEVAKVVPPYVFEEAGFECLETNEYVDAIVIPDDNAKVEVF